MDRLRWTYDRVRERTGVTPGIHTSKSMFFAYDCIDSELDDQSGRESWVHDYYSGRWDGKAWKRTLRDRPETFAASTASESCQHGGGKAPSAEAHDKGARNAREDAR